MKKFRNINTREIKIDKKKIINIPRSEYNEMPTAMKWLMISRGYRFIRAPEKKQKNDTLLRIYIPKLSNKNKLVAPRTTAINRKHSYEKTPFFFKRTMSEPALKIENKLEN